MTFMFKNTISEARVSQLPAPLLIKDALEVTELQAERQIYNECHLSHYHR